jgi:transposase
MQGRKRFLEKTRLRFKLSERVPAGNFYRRLKDLLDVDFLYNLTAPYYGKCGQKSIDAVVFFKFMLVAHLENISSDRKLLEHCSLRLDILYFLGYDLDEPLPWHSTLSRTRQLLGKAVFEALFEKVFALCVEKGMVSGETQCIDSALVKANASLDSLLERRPAQSLELLPTLKVTPDGSNEQINDPKRAAKFDRSTLEQQTISAPDFELEEIKQRQKHWAQTQIRRPGATDERSRYLSNKTHYSPTDPDSRIAVKPGKARNMSYLASVSVDKAQGVITHMQADLADGKDNQFLISIVEALQKRFKNHQLPLKKIVADTGYSSGEIYQYLENQHLTAYIPIHGTFVVEREGFSFDSENDLFICSQGKRLPYQRHFVDRNHNWKKHYRASRKDCNTCPIREACLGKVAKEKKFDVTYFYHYYQRAYQRQISSKGQYHKKLRQSKVEPVLGTLINFLGMRRLTARGKAAAHKVMLMSAVAFNLKKLLKYAKKRDIALANALRKPSVEFIAFPSYRSFLNLRQHFILKNMSKSRCIKLSFKVVQQRPVL